MVAPNPPRKPTLKDLLFLRQLFVQFTLVTPVLGAADVMVDGRVPPSSLGQVHLARYGP